MTPAAQERSGPDVVRAFFGVEIGESARHAAAELARRLGAAPGGDGVRWVRPGSFHITLRFLGSVAAAAIDGLAARAAQAVAPLPSFRVELGALGAFPSPRRPRVVVLAVTPEAPLRELAARLEPALAAEGFPAEPRPFRAHLTLGRVARGERPRLDLEAEPPPPAPFEVAEVVLFRSQTGRGGSLYTPLARLPLAAGAHPRSLSPSATRPFEGDEHGQARTHL